VVYTDPLTEKEASVTSHNLGTLAMNGGIVSDTRNYHGIRNPILAKIVADRDVESAGYPVFACQAKVERTFWRVRPGDVVVLSWPEEGLVNAVMRVMGVDYGSPKNRTITLDLSEDVFALEQTSYSGLQRSLLATDRVAATPMDVETVITAPLPSMVRAGVTVAEVDESEPVVAGLIMADNSPRPLNIRVHTAVVKGNGDSVVEEVTTIPVTASALTEDALVAEALSRVPETLVEVLLQGNQEVGDILMLGAEEAGSELIMLTGFDAVAEEWIVIRGVWDTVPAAWPVGSRIWAFPAGTLRADPGEPLSGETRTYRLLPRTSYNALAYGEASDLTVTFSERPFAPFRPADCELDGTGFTGVDYSRVTLGTAPPATVTATWANRNRQTEDQIANEWTDAGVTPEPGQTTVLRIFDAAGNYSHESTRPVGKQLRHTDRDVRPGGCRKRPIRF